MIYLVFGTIAILTIVIISLLTAMNSFNAKYLSSIEESNRRFYRFIEDIQMIWNDERNELLDRIQAPSFGEMKSAEIKMVKAQQKEEPQPSFILE
jgi:hypothetical protein